MAKFAVIFLAALAFQASLAIPTTYQEEYPLFNYLDEIKTEVKELSLYLEKDFPEDRLAVKTVTWQCHKLVEAVEVIISKLREETFTNQQDGLKVFKQVVTILEQVRDSLKQVTLYRDISNVYELKKNFVLSINVVYEHLEKLVHLTYKLFPEFQYTLKYIIVDFITTIHGIRSHFVHINQGYEIPQTPLVLIKEIHDYTRECTEIIKEFTHPSQIKVALRGYILYVSEIVSKLEEKNILGHKEIDVLVHHLTNKLREIVFPVTEIVDIKIFRTKVISQLDEVVSIFEQLVQLCEDKVLPVEVRTLLLRIIYHYYYAIKHVVYEIKFGYKIGFFKPEYYNTEYYGTYGYGLYESEFYNLFYTPYKYNNKLYDIPFFYKNYQDKIYTPYRYETLFPVHKYESEYLYGKTYGLNYHDKYFSGLKYDYQTSNDLVLTIKSLVKRMYEHFEYNTLEVAEVKPAFVYKVRELIYFLDYVLEKFETKVTFEQSFFTDKLVEEFIYKIKEIKKELNIEVFTNVREFKLRFVRYIEVVATELYKLIEKYEVRDYELSLIKNICNKFISYLKKMSYETTYSHEYVSTNEYKTPKDLVWTIQSLVKRVNEYLQYSSYEVSETKPVFVYKIREFIYFLDYVLEKFESKVTFERSLYTDKLVGEFIYKIKEIKRELKEVVSFEAITNVREFKLRFVRYIEVVATELYKLIEKYEVRDFELTLVKDICVRFLTFLNKFGYERTYSRNYYSVKSYETSKDLVLTIQSLIKRVYKQFEYNTFEVSATKPILGYKIREFIYFLDYILEKFETKVSYERILYSNTHLHEFIYKIKDIRKELKQFVSIEDFTNVREFKLHFVRYIEVVATELYKLIENYEVHDFEFGLIKDICIRFITFLNKISYERTYNSEYYPVKDFTGDFHKYYKDNTVVPYSYNVYSHVLPYVRGGWLNYYTEKYPSSVYNRLY